MRAHRILAAVAAAAVVTTVQVRWSERSWRLDRDVDYDDVTYVAESAQWLDVWAHEGARGLFMKLWRTPPISPYQATVGTIGLLTLGLHDSSVYFADVLLLVATSLLLLYAFREESGWIAGLAVAFFLTSSLAARCVVEFRPDLANGIATATFAFFFTRGVLFNRSGEVRLSGLLFGLALLTKPTFFAHTLVIGTWMFVLYLALRAFRRQGVAGWRDVGWAVLIVAVLAGPFYARTGAGYFQYFWVNTRSTALFLFEPGMSWTQVVYRYTLARYHGMGIIGWHGPLDMAVCLAAAAWFGWLRRWKDLLVVVVMMATALLSLAIITAGRLDNQFFATTFHASLLFTALYSAVAAACDLPARGRRWAFAGAGAVLATLAFMNSWPQHWDIPADTAPGMSWNDALIRSMIADARRQGIPVSEPVAELDGFITAVGTVSAHSLMWTAAKSHLHLRVDQDLRAADAATLADEAKKVDYIVVPNSDKAAVLRVVPAPTFMPELLGRFRSDPDLERIPSGWPEDPDRYFLFANRSKLEERLDGYTFAGGRLERFEGFLAEEGPYPQWNLPRVRWLSAPRGRFCVSGVRAGDDVRLTAALRPAIDGVLRASVAGHQAATTSLRRDVESTLNVTFVAAQAGPCVEVAVDGTDATDSRRVLFQRVRVRVKGH